MTRRPQPISRRHMLRGIGASMGLPLLEAMEPLSRASAALPAGSGGRRSVRMGFLFMPNGVNASHWTPEGKGSKFKLSKTLSPLDRVRNDILVLTNLWNRASKSGDGHYVKVAGLLTGTTITKTTGKDLNSGGISVDQVAAREIGRDTKLPSLELGIEPVTTGIDTNVNYTRLYGSHIAWKSPTSPIPCEINPMQAFNRLFRAPGKQDRRNAADTRSVIDLVLEDARSLKNKVGYGDKQKIDEYLESVRAVERRIEFDAKALGAGHNLDPEIMEEIKRVDASIRRSMGLKDKSLKELSSLPRLDHTEHVRLMFDIMALAFWTDSTRVSTFMFGNAVSGKNFSFLDGVSGGHHQISHHSQNAKQLVQYQLINQWHIEQYRYLIERLKGMKEAGGSVLDNSMIFFGSGQRDGNSHDPRNLPIVLAGRAGGRLKPGRHLEFDRDTPLCNLYLGMLKRAGVKLSKFGDSKGELKGLG